MATLHVTDGPAQGESYALEQHNVLMIGRDAVCSFQIIDPQLSRVHLQVKFVQSEGRHYAIDFDSKNGVWVKGIKIDSETPLSDGDVIKIGDTTILYSTDDTLDAQQVRKVMKLFSAGRDQTMTNDDA